MSQVAVIAGVGPGLGESIARKFANEGLTVALLARTGSFVENLADDLPTQAVGVQTDLADAGDIDAAFVAIQEELGPVDVLVNHASSAAWSGIRHGTAETFERAWRVTARGAYACSAAVVDGMVERGAGTIVFTGATSGVRGRDGAAGFASAKFAVRGLAQSMAQELGPDGVQVSHVVIDGQIRPPSGTESTDRDPETFLDPDDLAEVYWNLVEQEASTMTVEVHVTNGYREIEFL
ncbi:MAG: NADP-dependent 3-hydroxy acid dehydrogenase YdfG [Halobacteriales archaeon]|jgi:NADP-dependent 3-hydroxy acid dehydrogenase YdfG